MVCLDFRYPFQAADGLLDSRFAVFTHHAFNLQADLACPDIRGRRFRLSGSGIRCPFLLPDFPFGTVTAGIMNVEQIQAQGI